MPDEVEEEKFANFQVDFPTWTVSFEKKISQRGKRIDYEGTSVDPFWTRKMLDMTPEDIMEVFVIYNVRV